MSWPEYAQKLREALKFCRDIAAEEYDYQQTNVGAELVLRHIMRKCDEALAPPGPKEPPRPAGHVEVA